MQYTGVWYEFENSSCCLIFEFSKLYRCSLDAQLDRSDAPNIVQIIAPNSLQSHTGLLAVRRIVSEISMRAQRDIRRAEQKAVRQTDASVNTWRTKVAGLTSASPPTLSMGEIRALLFVLSGYLSVAPYEEDAIALLPFVQQLRHELGLRTGPPRPCPE